MDMNRAILAVAISFLILFGYNYFFIQPTVEQQQAALQQEMQMQQAAQTAEQENQAGQPAQTTDAQPTQTTELTSQSVPSATQDVAPLPEARDIVVNTPLYTVVINEQGGGVKSFVLKKYRKENDQESDLMELVQTQKPGQLPLQFSAGSGLGNGLPFYHADSLQVDVTDASGKKSLNMKAVLSGGIELSRTMTFDPSSYLITESYHVQNTTGNSVTISPALSLANMTSAETDSTSTATNRFMFRGPAVFVDSKLHKVKDKKLDEGEQTFEGTVGWAAYEDNYFICAVIPGTQGKRFVKMSSADDTVRTVMGEESFTLAPGAGKEFKYDVYFGPKKLSILNSVNHELSSSIDFGWFTVIAKPMLWLLNFFHTVFKNYGIAIILLTILIKAVFWPISQKGMKSMKNMQKLQPKVAKLKEKFKDDPQKMNQEMMALYKTYKVNPLGGCLPMFLQIPFFFALYKVLLLSIELRHAPFMLWINDLSAPDRLMIGSFDIPYLHGIPVLTLLMGASMYLQQKMTPTTADPTQARIMQMLPVIFTFMFLNFASGLVLYWFVNNLLSILQQQLINRQTRS